MVRDSRPAQRDRDRGRGQQQANRRGDSRGEDQERGRRGGGAVRRDHGNSGGRNFRYQERSVDQVRRQAERQTGRFDSPVKKDFDIWRPSGGENNIRILPATWENAEHYAFKVWMHKFIGSDGSSYLCPRKMLGKPCAICDAERDARDAGENDEAKDLTAQPQWVCWMLDRGGDNQERPMLYFMSDVMDKDIVSLTYNSRRGDALKVDHPEVGRDLTIRRTGQGLKTRYGGFRFDPDATPVLDDATAMNEVLDFIEENPIPSVLNYYDNAYLENVISGTTARSDNDQGDEGQDNEGQDDGGDDGGDDRGADDNPRSRRKPLRSRQRDNQDDEVPFDDDDRSGDDDGDDGDQGPEDTYAHDDGDDGDGQDDDPTPPRQNRRSGGGGADRGARARSNSGSGHRYRD